MSNIISWFMLHKSLAIVQGLVLATLVGGGTVFVAVVAPVVFSADSAPHAANQREYVEQSAPVTLHMAGATTNAFYYLDATSGLASRLSETSPNNFVTSPGPLASDSDNIYMSDAQGYLSTIDHSDGTYERVDNAPANMNISESSPRGLAVVGNTLYMVGAAGDRLYTLNTNEGVAVPVGDGSITAFGVGETEPGGIAELNGTLYMVGQTTDNLYTLSTTTGQATRVGSASAFGVSESTPTGLAGLGGTLYMVGAQNLYTLDTSSGVATRVGTSSRFGTSETVRSLGVSGGVLYGVTYTSVGSDFGRIYELDTNTGTSLGQRYSDNTVEHIRGLAEIGGVTYILHDAGSSDRLRTVDTSTTTWTNGIAYGALNFGYSVAARSPMAFHNGELHVASAGGLFKVNTDTGVAFSRVNGLLASTMGNNYAFTETSPGGFAYLNGELYMVGTTCDCLYRVDTTSGSINRISSVASFGITGITTPAGLAALGGTLYMVDDGTNALYTLSTTTGRATRVGSATNFGESLGAPGGLAGLNGELYMVDYTTDALYTLNTSNGTATRVGSATRFGLSASSSAVAPRGLAGQGGTLYMVDDGTNALYTLNTSNGTATRVGSTTSFGISEGTPSALASSGSVLYMSGTTQHYLATLNTSNGAATRIGFATDFGYGDTTITGLVSHAGILYAVGSVTDRLYRMGTDTGLLHGISDITSFGLSITAPRDLASDDTNLYMVAQGNLYTLNVSSGAATRVGTATNFGVSETQPYGLTHFDDAQFDYTLPDSPSTCGDSDITNPGTPTANSLTISGDFATGSCRLSNPGDVEEFYEDAADLNHAHIYGVTFENSRSVNFNFNPQTSFEGTPILGQYRIRVRQGGLTSTVLGTATGAGALELANISVGGNIQSIIEVMRWGVGGDTEFSVTLNYAFIAEPTPTPAPTPTPRAQAGVDVRIHPDPVGIGFEYNQVYPFTVEGSDTYFPVTIRVSNSALTHISKTSGVVCPPTASQVTGVTEGGAFYISICRASDGTRAGQIDVLSEENKFLLDRKTVLVAPEPFSTPEPVSANPGITGVSEETARRDVLGLSILIGAVCEAAGVRCLVEPLKNTIAILAAALVGMLPTLVVGGRVSTASIGIGIGFFLLGLMVGWLWVGVPLWYSMVGLFIIFLLASAGILVKAKGLPT